MESQTTTAPKVKPIPDGMHTVTPHLCCAGAGKAIDFYVKAFGATELCRIAGPDGNLMHGAIRIGDSMIFLHDEFPAHGSVGPKARGGSSVTIHLQVEDADASFARAIEAGVTVKMPPADMFWGDRYCKVTDPFGHNWAIATHKEDVSPEEMDKRMKKEFGA